MLHTLWPWQRKTAVGDLGTIPIFIISFNRLTVLRRAIASFQRLAANIEIVIIDTGSTFEPLLDYYRELEEEGAVIYYVPPLNDDPESLNGIAGSIERHKTRRSVRYYVVTDPDISLEIARPDSLDVYAYMLERFSRCHIVGPMLRISDIPETYPAREYALKRHVKQFWRKKPRCIRWGRQRIYYQKAPIDTTFGMVRACRRYERHLYGIRVYHPYEALHLDWYIDPDNVTEDQKLYCSTASKVAHWGGAFFHTAPNGKLSDKDRMIYVVENDPADNNPRCSKIKIP